MDVRADVRLFSQTSNLAVGIMGDKVADGYRRLTGHVGRRTREDREHEAHRAVEMGAQKHESVVKSLENRRFGI